MSRHLLVAAALAVTTAAGVAFAPAATAGNVAWNVSLGGPGYAVSFGQPGWGPGYVNVGVAGCGYNCYGGYYAPPVPAPVYAPPVVVPYVRVAPPVVYPAPVVYRPVVVVAPRGHRHRPYYAPAPVYAPPVAVPYGRY
jgi:hypothetical protein